MKNKSILAEVRKTESQLLELRQKKEMLIKAGGLTLVAPYLDEIIDIRSKINKKSDLNLMWLKKKLGKIESLIAKSGTENAKDSDFVPRRKRSRIKK